MPGSLTIVLASASGGELVRSALDSISRALASPSDASGAGPDVDVVVVTASGTAATVPTSRWPAVRLAAIEASSDPAAMRNAGVDAASGDLVWLLDERGIVTRGALDAHLGHDRAAAAVLMGPCPVPGGHTDVVDEAWWYTERAVRLGERGVVTDPRDVALANTSAPTAVLRAHPSVLGYRRAGVGEVELGMVLLEAGHVIAFDPAAAIDALDAPASHDVTDHVHDGADRARFLARHPQRTALVLGSTPGGVERALRRAVATSGPLRRPISPSLVTGAGALAGASSLPVIGRAGHHLRRFSSLLATYGGVAAVASGEEVVRQAVAASLTNATVLPGRMSRWVERLADPARMRVLPLRVHHVHGPRVIERDRRTLLAITVVRNGRFYVASFLDHHRRLGIDHFVVLDNGSTDGTVAFLSAQPDVTVLRTSVPYKRYENLMKRYLVRRFSTGRWNVFVDIDELFDYPGSDRLDLRGLLEYLDQHRFTAVVAQMLDLFPREPLVEAPTDPPDDLGERYPYFDVSDISKRPYHYDEDPTSSLLFYRGGIRRTVFGSENALTKAAVVFVDDRIDTFVDWHHARRATFADITCVLRHYPFAPTFAEKAEEAARTSRYGRGASHEYRAYWAVVSDAPDLRLHRPTAQRFEGVQQLLDMGFLQASERYWRWVDERGTRGPVDADQ